MVRAQGTAEPNCATAFRKMASTLKANWQAVRGKATLNLDPESFALFERVRLNPAAEISTAEMELLRTNGNEELFRRYQEASVALKSINHFYAVAARSRPMKNRSFSWTRGMLDSLPAVFAPGLPVGITGRARLIYQRALRSPDFVLSAQEEEFLRTWKFWEDFQRFEAEGRRYRKEFLASNAVGNMANNLRWGWIASAGMGAPLIPYLTADRISSPEELKARVEAIKGGVQLLVSDSPTKTVMLRTDTEGVMFGGGKAKFYRGEKLKELEEEIAAERLDYSRIAFRADADEAKRVMKAAKEFVTRTRTGTDGQKELDVRAFVDAPLAEAYKILEDGLGLPPAPIVKRHDSYMGAYFGVMKFLGGKDGRVQDYFRARAGENSPSEWQDAADAATSAYLNGLLYASKSGKLLLPPALALDAMPTTRRQTVLKIEEQRGDK